MVVMSGTKSEIRARAVARRTCELVRMRRHVGFRAGRAGLGGGWRLGAAARPRRLLGRNAIILRMTASPGSRCARCQQESPPGARFCVACGARLGARCAARGAELADGARFCPACGRAVEGAPPAEAPPAPESYTPRPLDQK